MHLPAFVAPYMESQSGICRRVRSLPGARSSLPRGPHTISLGDRPTDRPTEFRIVISKSS